MTGRDFDKALDFFITPLDYHLFTWYIFPKFIEKTIASPNYNQSVLCK